MSSIDGGPPRAATSAQRGDAFAAWGTTAKRVVSKIAAIVLAVAVFDGAAACGGNASEPAPPSTPQSDAGASPGGFGAIFIGALGNVIATGTYFAAYRDCAALPLDDICRVRHHVTCIPDLLSPNTPTPNAGTITLTDGIETATAVPDSLGLYSGGGAKLDVSRKLKVAATGGIIPAFEAEIFYPAESLSIETPARSSAVSRSAPLAVTWTGSTTAEFASISIDDTDIGGKSVECQTQPMSASFEMGTQFTAMLRAGKSARVSVVPANAQRLKVGDWTIDVVAAGFGRSYMVEVVP